MICPYPLKELAPVIVGLLRKTLLRRPCSDAGTRCSVCLRLNTGLLTDQLKRVRTERHWRR